MTNKVAMMVELLQATITFLASDSFVYLLGSAEVALALALLAGIGVRYARLVLVAGTLVLLVVAPQVISGDLGLPFISARGELLLKDVALLAAAQFSDTFNAGQDMQVGELEPWNR